MRVNGEEIVLGKELSLQDFLTREGYAAGRIAVELNGQVIPKSQYDSVRLCETDRLEIVNFVGGG